jgi:hypothetical protein
MVAPETRVTVEVPPYGEIMDQVRAEVLRLVGEKALEFQREQFHAWLVKTWERDRDAKGLVLCPRCAASPSFESRGRCFHTRYGKVKRDSNSEADILTSWG